MSWIFWSIAGLRNLSVDKDLRPLGGSVVNWQDSLLMNRRKARRCLMAAWVTKANLVSREHCDIQTYCLVDFQTIKE